MADDNGITMPTVRLTIEYGLDDEGESIMAERWENLADPGFTVPMITKAGMLAMAQQTLTYYALGMDDDDE